MRPLYSQDCPMTIVVAMLESENSILVAADGEVTALGGLKSRMQKLIQCGNQPLVWAARLGLPATGCQQ